MRKRGGLVVFGGVLASYLVLTVIAVLLSLVIVGDIDGPQPTRAQEVVSGACHAMARVLLFPLDAIHDRYFVGQPLPANDWLWLIGLGSFYGIVAVLARDLPRRIHRP